MKVTIELRTAMDEQGQLEYHTTQATGDFYRKGTTDVVMFDEQTGDGTIKNMLTIQTDKVSIKRTGAMTMHQQFILDHPSENVLHHPYGTIHMATTTQMIHYDAARGRLTIDYEVMLNGQEPRTQQLDILIGQDESRSNNT